MRILLLALTTISLLGVGCSSQTSQPIKIPKPVAATPSVNAEDACDSLLPLDRAKQTIGPSYTKRDSTTTMLGTILVTTCTYYDGNAASRTKPFSILTRRASSKEEAKQIFEESKHAAYTDSQPLSGIGEESLWSPTFKQISTLKGQTWLIVSAQNEATATTITKDVISRIE